ncbi:glyoxalase [Paenibacillus sp. ACRRX]|uniref:VOC family protein n=1 Tax=unclassified Paenibacillus TaxID=185978 RepID=UPI001EF41B30|nr:MULTISPECIES: glyoxalase [unclassified Paenibacillus]MCG7409244.1 glyoxalase [Paenibacillus sp. ACRRX]MDK8179899.1 glyoxalase [Paenibacillus sp. UMB4589-SE434]
MRIKEIVLQTHLYREMKQFYSELLQFPIEDETIDSFSLRAGASKLTFQRSTDSQNYYHFAFMVPSNQLDEAGHWLQAKGIKLFSKDNQNQFFFEDWNATATYFYDPQSNLVELIAHHSLTHFSKTAFGHDSILCISEIGLPLLSVEDELPQICDVLSQKMWRGDGKQFAGVGDAEGLLIVIDITRPWFPDGRMPRVCLTKVILEGGSEQNLELQDLPYQISSES